MQLQDKIKKKKKSIGKIIVTKRLFCKNKFFMLVWIEILAMYFSVKSGVDKLSTMRVLNLMLSFI